MDTGIGKYTPQFSKFRRNLVECVFSAEKVDYDDIGHHFCSPMKERQHVLTCEVCDLTRADCTMYK